MAAGPLTPSHMPQVAVIGGGCAGLAAAARLAEAGIPTTLLEAAPQLGGRARGLNWKGQRLDNGQHILLGAYDATLALMRLVGLDPEQGLLRLPLQLRMQGEFELRARSGLPAPLHLLAGLLSAHGLSWGERLAAIRFMAVSQLNGFRLANDDEPLLQLLQRRGQPARVIRLLWEPLCLAALNTPVDCASAQVFLNVLRDSFARSRADSDLLLPRLDLGALLSEPVAAYLRSKGGTVETGVAVRGIEHEDNGYRLQLQDGANLRCSRIIVAVAPTAAAALLAQLPALATEARQCRQLRHQPIYTVYLQYATTARLPMPMIGLADGHGQWLFDRGRLYGQDGLMAVVISTEGPHQAMRQQLLAASVAAELARAFPELGEPLWHKVIAEKRATFACTPNLTRPGQHTALPGLYLAGDYTAGDYPATIEGAVRSGVQCADHIITASRRP